MKNRPASRWSRCAGSPRAACSKGDPMVRAEKMPYGLKTVPGTIAPGRMRKTATVCARMAVGLLLGSAVTIAFVAAGLDLFPLRP